MPEYNQNHALLRFGGPSAGGAEQWSCGLRLKHLGGDELNALRQETIDTLETVADICVDYVNDANAAFNGLVAIEWVKLDAIRATTGKYAFPDNPNTFELEAPDTAAGPPGPLQVAYRVTTRGLFKRGPAARGGWFVPVGAAGVTNAGRISEANAQLMADAAGSFLRNLAEIDSGSGPDAWAPWLYGDGVTGPRDSVINAVQVGDVYDTQRRRRNELDELYVPSTTYPF